MKFADGYIINPPEFRAAHLTISPFSRTDAHINKKIWCNSGADNNPVIEFDGRQMSVTESATKALEIALCDLHLKRNSEIWIITTSGNYYISGCVTRTVERFCRWSRRQTKRTAAILVNHEFGYLYRSIRSLKKTGLPLIEDKAYSMYSVFDRRELNFAGDYVIFSMAKMFPMQAGGLLYAHGKTLLQDDISADATAYYKACFEEYNRYRYEIIHQRIHIYEELAHAFANRLNFTPRFAPAKGEVPGAFLFRAEGIDLNGLKTYMQRHGIECSVFYGDESFYIPCHQKMDKDDVDYITSIIKNFIQQ